MELLRVSLVQADIAWEEKEQNLRHYGQLIEGLAGKSDLVVLPEMFSTGFSMNGNLLAETVDGNTIRLLQSWSDTCDFAIAGSFLSKDESGENFYNRGFFLTPGGESFFYDKRHLFRSGAENEHFLAGNEQLTVTYKGWNIRLIICYDLRFPVWIRNVDNAYDVLLCTANWPESRISVWNTLLKARAIENLCYVCGANRIGKDGYQLNHKGHSMIIGPKGDIWSGSEENKEAIISYALQKSYLNDFRRKFPAWKDADQFEIKLD